MYNNNMNDQNKIFTIVDALQSLVPKAQWTLIEFDYSGLDWISTDIEKPSEKDLLDEVKRLQDEYDALEYQRLRASEYPDIKEYIDGIVKNDEAQIQAYIDACIKVKEKYPKPKTI